MGVRNRPARPANNLARGLNSNFLGETMNEENSQVAAPRQIITTTENGVLHIAGGQGDVVEGGDNIIVSGLSYSFVTGGVGCVLMGGPRSTVIGGFGSIARAGEESIIIILLADDAPELNRTKKGHVAVVGKNGIKPFTFYKINADGNFEETTRPF